MCVERRLLVREWDCFCLGTAIERGMVAGGSAQLQIPQLRPAWVACRLVTVLGGIDLVQVHPAFRAQTPAVGAAHDLGRNRQHKRFSGPVGEVQDALVEVGTVQIIVIARLLDLPRVHRDAGRGGPHTPHARAFQERIEAQPQRISGDGAGDIEAGGDRPSRNRVPLPAELQRIDTHLGIDSLPIPGAQLQGLEIEEIHALWHALMLDARYG